MGRLFLHINMSLDGYINDAGGDIDWLWHLLGSIPAAYIAGRVVKGVQFGNLRDVGDPAELATRYEAEGADEIVFLHRGRVAEPDAENGGDVSNFGFVVGSRSIAVIDSGIDANHPELAGSVADSLDTVQSPFAPHDHGTTALAERETPCYSGEPPYNRGLFHTGCGGGPEGKGERTIFGLNTAIQPVCRPITSTRAGVLGAFTTGLTGKTSFGVSSSLVTICWAETPP